MTDRKPIVLEPKTQAFIDALQAQGGKPIYQLSYKDARKVRSQECGGLAAHRQE